MSLEVAEHLSPERAEGFIRDLTQLSNAVLFSAAIPGQGGTNHINERETSYWVSLFQREGYIPISCIRPLFKSVTKSEDLKVCAHYANNTILYINSDYIHEYGINPDEYPDDFSLLPFMERGWAMSILRDDYILVPRNRITNAVANTYHRIFQK